MRDKNDKKNINIESENKIYTTSISTEAIILDY